MPLPNVTLLCPHCKNADNLFVYPCEHYKVKCKKYKHEWEHHKINEICYRLIRKVEVDRTFQHYAACLRIQMQYMMNPFGGAC